jgi:L-ascorbate metabolism protein UlaG (beta-lactamase superfamily)
MAEIKVTFIGHASFRFESEQSVTYFDAWFDDNPMADTTLAEVDRADLVIATHGHRDHIGDTYRLAKQTGATFVGNFELCLVAAEHGLPIGERALPMNPGGTVRVADLQVTMTQAHHSLSLAGHVLKGDLPENMVFHPDSAVSGFVLAYDNGITIYDTSDTCVFSDMQLIGQMHGPQIAIMPVGGKFTMGVREAARAASFIQPDIVIPCHYGETMGQPADIDALSEAVRFLSPNTKVVGLEPGQSMRYTSSSFAVEE